MILPGDLLFVHGGSWIDKDIEEISHSAYSHVAIFVAENELIEAQGLRKVGYQDAGVYAEFSDVYRCDFVTLEQRCELVEIAKSHVGQDYDYWLILLELIRYTFGVIAPWHEHHVVICSTLIAECFRGIDLDPCPGIRNPSPGDLANSNLFRRLGIYEW